MDKNVKVAFYMNTRMLKRIREVADEASKNAQFKVSASEVIRGMLAKELFSKEIK